MSYKPPRVHFDAFSRQNRSFIFPQNRDDRNESVKCKENLSLNVKILSKFNIISTFIF